MLRHPPSPALARRRLRLRGQPPYRQCAEHHDRPAPMKLIDAFSPWLTELTAIRHSIHAWPELGFQENRTADTVANQLHDWGIETHRGQIGRASCRERVCQYV